MEEKKKKWIRRAGLVMSLGLLAGAIWFLHRELDHYRYGDIVHSINKISGLHLVAAFGLTVLNYLLLTFYDVLALRYIDHSLEYRRVALASFIGYAFNNLGLSMIAGSSLRYRFYMAWNLTAENVTKVVLFYNVTIWIGLFALGGLVFFLVPMGIPRWLHAPFASTRPLGAVLLSILTVYLLASLAGSRTIRLRKWTFAMPSKELCSLQVAASTAAWLFSAGVLFALLPHTDQLTATHFVEVFMLAQIAGIVSQVPGGLGVFESVMVVGIGRAIPFDEILGALMLFRIIYYFLPLILGMGLLGAYELLGRKTSSSS
ncbi:MAG: lysylphosphatidylglycerol synthase domain-containing protein [Acidobacteriota bacterium]